MVNEPMKPEAFATGDRVIVPWGLDSISGVVQRVIERGTKYSLEVLVTLPGSDEPESVVFPIDAVKPDADDPATDRVGAWLNAFHYQEALFAAISSILSTSDFQVEPGDLVSTFHVAADRTDIEARLSNGTIIIIEAKKVRRVTSKVVKNAVEQLRRYIESDPMEATRAAGLIVFSEVIEHAARQFIDTWDRPLRRVEFATWRGEQDDGDLQRALLSLTA